MQRITPRTTLVLIAIAVAVVSLAVAPYCAFRPDMRDYWIPWQVATKGLKPWNAYALPKCNYPPLILYVLSLVEGVRYLLDVSWKAPTNRLLMKLPNIAAHLIGAACLYGAFVRTHGTRKAALLAGGWLLSLNLFVNAALWAQWDVILALLLLLALLALRREGYFMTGVWTALAMAAKVQAIFILPVLGIYLLARRDVKAIGRTTAGAMLAILLVFGPMAIAGRLRESTSIYVASVDTFPYRSLDAWNHWFVFDFVEERFLGASRRVVINDGRPVIPALSTALTYKRVGLLLFGSYVLAMLIMVARRRRLEDVLVGVPLMGVAMFMLATQMHERYVGPPAALMTLWLLLPTPYRAHFIYWSIAAGLNQLSVLARFPTFGPKPIISNWHFYTGAVVSLVNLGMFIHLTWLFFSPRFASTELARGHRESDRRGFGLAPHEAEPAPASPVTAG